MTEFILNNGIWILILILIAKGLWNYVFVGKNEGNYSNDYHKKTLNFWKKPHTNIEEELRKYGNLIERSEYITTPSEALFFRRLSEYIQDKDYIICPKVRVGDIIKVHEGRNKFRPASIVSRTEKSHIDFVLIGKSDLKIKFTIELDDPSHESYVAQERDNVKDKIFDFVGIKLLRFSNPNATKVDFAEKGII